MTRYLIRWIVLFGWLVLMGVVYALFVPQSLAVGSFWVLAMTGPVLAVVLLMLWSSQQPAPSAGQQRVQLDEAEAAARAKKK
jgi:hypothetical protein